MDTSPFTMKFSFALLTTVLFLYSFSTQFTPSEAASCTRITYGAVAVPHCETYVVIEHKPVYKNQFDVIILLPEPLKSVRWFCGKYDGTLDWTKTGKKANEIRASFIAGELKLQVYWCDDLSGPTNPETCAFNMIGVACPGLNTSSHVCVYEIKKTTVSAKTKVDATKVEGTIAANVKNTLVGVSTSELRERTEATIVTYSSRSYIVVPSGYRFCSYSEAKAVKNSLAPTGYEWQCYSPKFLQGKTTGKCTDLLICRKVTCSTNKKQPAGSGDEVISPFDVLMLVVTATVVAICF